MNNYIENACPICEHVGVKNLLVLKTGNYDQSTLYNTIKINCCTCCGHIFNDLSIEELKGLADYYHEEKALTNNNSQDKTGDLPGSDNPGTIRRYYKLFNFIEKYLRHDSRILDFGFSKGGFLNFIKKNGYNNSYFIDVVEEYLGNSSKDFIKGDLKFHDKKSEALDDKSFDFVVIDQVLGHISSPRKIFQEVGRVLKKDGFLCIGIPDASRYSKNYFFDFYWFLLREHIQHFDLQHIKLLAAQENFELIDVIADDSVMMNETMVMPNLNLIFKQSNGVLESLDKSENFNLKRQIEDYIKFNATKLITREDFFNRLTVERIPLYVRGMSREFFYLYEAAGLKNCNIKGLIDSNPYKQNNLTVSGMKVCDEKALSKATESDSVIITATAHSRTIKDELQEKKYKINYLEFNR